MARPKRKSAAAAFAVKRASALASIADDLDLGSGLTLAAYREKIADLNSKNEEYNMKLSELDGRLNEIEGRERELDELSTRMLAGVAAKFGKNSDEYEKAGGTKTSERKPIRRRAKG